ncbi:MAG: peptidylprolyl isomerase [Actinomycetota bacterium]|nr:peptidylprolyl isomerase [Actinomycetota bacterium]
MPTNKQRREAARRHLERQLQRRQEREQARRKFTLIASIVGTLVLIVVVVVFVVAVGSDSKKHPTAAASSAATSTPAPTPTSTFVAQKTPGPCGYTTTNPAANPSLKDVGVPPDSTPTPSKDLTVDFQTNRGLIEASLDAKTAPCTVQSIAYLIQKKFYDNTPCPRVVNSGLFVVQCGSGGTSTAGGPTYTVPDENLAKANYAAGAIAMANTGQPHTGSSQFFFVTKDSNAGLGKSYTVFGHVTKGLNILQAVATGGNNGASSAGGGAPKLSLTFTSVKVVGTS